MKKPSRILNDESFTLGLDRNDIMALAVVFSIGQVIFKAIGFEYLSLFATVTVGLALVGIRLRYRRKIIRDTVKYYYYRLFKGGVYSDPS